jgi:hypothetical protein
MVLTQHQRDGAAPTQLALITGAGGRSLGGGAVLPGIVRRLLAEELHLEVEAAAEEGNPGRVVIGSEALQRWVRARSAARGGKAGGGHAAPWDADGGGGTAAERTTSN